MNAQPDKFQFILNPDADVPDVLGNAPDGWAETTVQFARSATYQGVVRSLSLPVKWTFKGAGIVRNAFYSKFLMARLPYQVNKQNTLTWEFEKISKGKIDFTQFDDGVGSVQTTLVEESFAEKIAAYDAIKYTIPIDIPRAIDLELTPIPFKEKAEFLFVPLSELTVPGFPGLRVVLNEVHATVESVQDVDFQIQETPLDYSTSNKWFYTARTNTNLSLLFTDVIGFTSAFTSGSTERFRIVIVDQTGTIRLTLLDVSHSSGVESFLISGTYAISLNNGDKLFMIELADGDSGVHGFIINQGQMSLSYKTESPSTLCKAIRAFDLFDTLIQKMNGLDTGGAYARQETRSYLLNGPFKDVYFTCSNSIRKIQNGTQYDAGDNLLTGATYLVINDDILYNSITYHPNAQFVAVEGVNTFTGEGSTILLSYQQSIVTSFKEFFQWAKSAMGGNVGAGLENDVMTLENMPNYFRAYTMYDASEIATKPSIKPALDYVFNSLKVGNEDPELDSLNAQQAVNSQQNYVGDLTTPAKELDLISPCIEEAYAIETIRFTPNDTAASRSSNRTCVIWAKPAAEIDGTFKPLRTEGYVSLVGVDAGPAYYNYNLSPKHKLMRGGPYLASVFYGQKNIRFASAEKNVNMVVVGLDGVRVAERDSLLVANLGLIVFIPVTFEFELALKEGALNSLNVMYGAVSFSYRDVQYMGFVIDTSVDVGQNSTRTFTLLSVPNNYLLKLVH